jgi:hypothetical protein
MYNRLSVQVHDVLKLSLFIFVCHSFIILFVLASAANGVTLINSHLRYGIVF